MGTITFGAAGGAMPPVIVPAAIDLSSGAYELKGDLLQLATRPTFLAAIADAIAAPPASRTWVNGANLASADCDTTTNDALRLNHGNVASDWFNATFTGPVLYEEFDNPMGDWYAVCRVATDAAVQHELCGLMVYDPATPAKFCKVQIGVTGGIKVTFQVDTNVTVASAALLAGDLTSGVWLAFESRGTYIHCYYNLTAQATPPTSGWVHLGAYNWWNASAIPSKLRVGCCMMNALNPTNGFFADFLYFDATGCRAHPYRGGKAATAGAGYKTGSPMVELVKDFDTLSATATVDQAKLRKLLASMEKDAGGGWTYGCIQGASAPVGNPAAFNAAAAVVVEGAGQYVSLQAKAASDGTQPASLRLGSGVVLPLSAL